jgi:hypothetical protein
MTRTLRRTLGQEVRYTLPRDADLPAAERPVFVLRVPTTSAFADLVDGIAGAQASNVAAVIRFVDRLEQHPDAEAFGAAESPARRAYVDAMTLLDVVDLARAIGELAYLTEDERKNSDSPSASRTTADGASDAASSTPAPTP